MVKKKLLEMIDVRNARIQEANAKRIKKGWEGIPKCTWPGCKHLVDATEGMGMDTSCPYHRLLFDYWLYNVQTNINELSKQGRRSAVTQWVNKLGKDKCDKIVDEMSRDPINWMC